MLSLVLLAAAPAFAQDAQLGPAPWFDASSYAYFFTQEKSFAKAVTTITPIATGSKYATKSAYQTYFLPAMPSIDFTGSVAGCTPGTISTAYKEWVVSRINYYRAMTGLPGSVGLNTSNPASVELEQQSAAVLYAANGRLSHMPSTANPAFTTCPGLIPNADIAGGKSNIALGFTDVVPGFMDDDGSGNELAGHRRWFLYPPQILVSVGNTSGGSPGNAIRVIDATLWGSRPAMPNGVAWPPAGFVPTQVLPPSGRWSYSLYNSGTFGTTDFAAANVSMTANGSPITVNVIYRSTGCLCIGDNTIVFVPQTTITAGVNYTVTVSGMAGASMTSYTYTVRPFDATATIPGVNGDFNGNGSSDLLFANTDGRAAIWLMNGTAPTATSEIIGAGTGWAVTNVGDFNGDGRTDLVWRHTDGRIAIYLMNGTAPTSTQQILNAGGWSVTHTPDLNGDGKADLVFQHTDGTIAVWTMNGTAMTAGASLMGPGSGWSVIRTADFDGDGMDDLLFRHTDGRHAIWLMNGTAIKSTQQILNAGGWTAMHTPDLNGDGKADIVWQHTDGTIAVWLMNGTAMTSGSGLLGAGSGWSVTRTGDFNGDGKADLFFLHTDGRAAIYLMNGLVPTQTTQILNAGGGWSAKRLVDLNGDGKADIVWQNVDGSTAVWLMNGTTMTSGTGILGTGTGWSVSAVSQ
ncbi:hypothetical protein BWI17_14645 [Betaproteobacteria bacterium GR16-43]|nr:hypothetical protein BWI17_14645 [Betaproteobacteria bacterium GR16-43]